MLQLLFLGLVLPLGGSEGERSQSRAFCGLQHTQQNAGLPCLQDRGCSF